MTSCMSLATVTFEMLGESRRLSAEVPCGPARLIDLFPAAAAIADEAANVTIAQARRAGQDISCKAGCGACCRQLVAISVVEARVLAEAVRRMPPERQAVIRERFAAAVARLEEAGLLDRTEPRGHRWVLAREGSSPEEARTLVGRRYFRLGIPCPFLENESCGIYADRPTVCRSYHVTSPAENCARLYEAPVDNLWPPVHVGAALGRLAEQSFGLVEAMLPLVLTLEWDEVHGAELEATGDGQQLFAALMATLST